MTDKRVHMSSSSSFLFIIRLSDLLIIVTSLLLIGEIFFFTSTERSKMVPESALVELLNHYHQDK